MKYKIIISDKAETLLTKHILFIAQVSKEAAKKTKKEIIDSINKLKDDPIIYPFLDDENIVKNKYHKYVINKRYIILYQVKDNIVLIDYILDTRQDYSWLIK